MSSILNDRKKLSYRILEGFVGVSSISFLILVLVLSMFEGTRPFVSVFLIIYSFLWVLKFSLNASYTIYSFKQLRRWETFNWETFFKLAKENRASAVKQLKSFETKFSKKIGWSEKINEDISNFKSLEGTKYSHPENIYHFNIFSVYNEPPEVLIRSLKCIYDSKYNLGKIIVFVTQEARWGRQKNLDFRESIKNCDWIETFDVSEHDLDKVYGINHSSDKDISSYNNPEFKKIKFQGEDKLTVVFTEHPDGLAGEVIGKASNEDWAGRQASLFAQSIGIDPEMVLMTSLDADSHIGQYFYHNLSYKFCICPDRLQSGFQPVHVYSNNFFQTGIWPRQVAAQTTIFNLSQLALEGETTFFAIYSVPLVVLREVDFWVREVIAEDSMLFTKCIVHYKGDFSVKPFYGVFEGDAVEADDYFEAILSQYKQLQRWSWGGVEGFPYIFKKFFLEKAGKNIDLRVRIKWVFLNFTNHFFWSSTPILFSVGVLLPQILGGDEFRSWPIAQNLSTFSQYFTWISFIFLAIFSYITISYVGVKASQNYQAKWYNWLLLVIQCVISPLIYFLMGFPALDAQIRGITGKYLAYVVTPKK